MLHSHSPSPSRFPFNNHSNDSKTESIIKVQRRRRRKKNFYIKTAQTVIQSRQQSPQKNDSTIDQDDGKRRINRWFNMNTREYPDSLRSELKYWITRAFVSPITQPPPLIIEIYLDITNIPAGKELALKHGWKLIDINLGASSNKKKNRILLENWILSLNHPLPTQPLDLGNVYKRSILFFRTLYAFTRLLPSYQTYQHIMLNNNNNTTTTTAAASTIAADDQSCLSIGYRFTSSLNNSKDDEIGLDEGPDANTITRNLDSIVTPLGILGLQVQYRANCDFIIHDPLAMNIDPPLSTPATTTTDASAQLMDLDQYYFTPTIAKYNPTNDSTDEEDEKEEHGFKTITKASILKQKATMTDWPPIPRKSESARVTTATTSSASPFHQRQEYNRRRPSSSSAYRRNMNNNTNTITSVRPANLSLRPLSMNDGDTLFIKSSSTAEPPPPPPAPPLSPSSSSRLHVSPFKSPTLSSSSQHSSTFSLRSLRGVDDEKNSIKSNITRRFSSSFDYRHTERYYHSAPSGGGAEHSNEMQEGSSTTTTSKTRSRRSFSVARKPASSIVSSVDQDDELEEFVRSLNLRQTPEFQSRLLSEDMSESNMHYMDGPSRDVSASYYRSKVNTSI
ncbi:autophagy-related protein 13-domain-containing protein [Phascolomyces articulosus]|uniref:Autophagy-related protein 13 n=1 Tax=Phascolomyces articulosus TaxID=60185 RepID=A0AAD5KEJ9_9FUNG|nr:autophagy-related protein 13-domain-containing protein [Phascolomyces articulosus]